MDQFLCILTVVMIKFFRRDIVRNSVHASEHDSVIFCGSGTTTAVHKLVQALDLERSPVGLEI
jgi:selenocysteine lyase/cysteine desulfurase